MTTIPLEITWKEDGLLGTNILWFQNFLTEMHKRRFQIKASCRAMLSKIVNKERIV